MNPMTIEATASKLYDDSVSIGMEMVAAMDRNRWQLGDLAAALVPVYGKNIVGKFAIDIHCVKKTLQSYERAASYYEDKNLRRSRFIEANPMLTWTHYREAMRLDDVEASYSFLSEASSEGWTAEQAAIESGIKTGKENQWLEFESELINISAFKDWLLKVPDAVRSGKKPLQPGKVYRVRIDISEE